MDSPQVKFLQQTLHTSCLNVTEGPMTQAFKKLGNIRKILLSKKKYVMPSFPKRN